MYVFAVFGALQTLCDEFGAHLRDGRNGERLRDGVRVCLGGKVNVGKSTLMNLLG